VQVKQLSERIEAVEDMGVQTVHAEQLLKAAKIVYRIRSAMVGAQCWPTARHCVRASLLCHVIVSLPHCVIMSRMSLSMALA
jgi:hypothetical protein